jgi:hypothetical protein
MLWAVILVVVILLIFKESLKEGFEDAYTEPHVTKVGIVSMMKKPKNIETWLQKHRDLGISKFYIRLEQTPELEKVLKQDDIYLQIGASSGVDEYNDIQTRQIKWIDEALPIAAKDGIDWLVHIDSDEILDGDLDEIRDLPFTTHTFWMQNVEAVYEDVPTESDNCFVAAKFLNCEKARCVSYVNGKSGGRTLPGVSSNGPHRFKSSNNSEVKLKMLVEHYESCDFNTYREKFTRLANKPKLDSIPFPYYKDSIKAAGYGNDALECVFSKYRTVDGDSVTCDDLLK